MEQFEYAGYEVINSWKNLRRDWNSEEARQICRAPYNDGPVLFHNHSNSWNQDLVHLFRTNGWTIVMTIRDTADQLCSIYHFQRMKGKIDPNISLDEFIQAQFHWKRNISLLPIQWAIQDYWEDVDLMIHRDPDMFPALKKIFGLEHELKKRSNASDNTSYDDFVAKGQISPKSQEIVENSDCYSKYLTCLNKRFNLTNIQAVPLPRREVLKLLKNNNPKAVAKRLNLDSVPTFDGRPEWTYKSVLAFTANS